MRMPLRHTVVLFPLIFSAVYQQCQAETRPEVNELKTQSLFETAVRRHFASVGGYHEGDLITRSQVEELQDFLRETQGHSAATHPRVLRRFLPDDTRLVQLFYKNNGNNTLRAAAAQNNGYEVFDRISRTVSDYSQLVQAVDHAELETIKKLAQKELQKRPAVNDKKANAPITNKPTRLYTVEQYLASFQPAAQNEKSTDQEKVPKQ